MTQRVVRTSMRPGFEIELGSVEGRHVLRQLAAQLHAPDAPVQGCILLYKAELTTCARACHAWSPWLSVQFADTPAGRQLLSGRFAPHPNVWTGFMAMYGVLLMVGLLGTMFGVSQWILHTPPWALLAAPGALVLSLAVYGGALLGQRLGADEMQTLRAFVEQAVRAAGSAAALEDAPGPESARLRARHVGEAVA